LQTLLPDGQAVPFLYAGVTHLSFHQRQPTPLFYQRCEEPILAVRCATFTEEIDVAKESCVIVGAGGISNAWFPP
jgi:hypothetical protein